MGKLEQMAAKVAKQLKPAVKQAEDTTPTASRDIYGTVTEIVSSPARVDATKAATETDADSESTDGGATSSAESTAAMALKVKVLLDGADTPSPATANVTVRVGDRVMCHIVQRKVSVVSNASSPTVDVKTAQERIDESNADARRVATDYLDYEEIDYDDLGNDDEYLHAVRVGTSRVRISHEGINSIIELGSGFIHGAVTKEVSSNHPRYEISQYHSRAADLSFFIRELFLDGYVIDENGIYYNDNNYIDLKDATGKFISLYAYGGSHAEGMGSYAVSAGHAEGFETVTTSGHSEGANTIASYYAHAEGYKTLAAGRESHSEGVMTLSEADGSHAEGYASVASGEHSHAEGVSNGALAKWFKSKSRYYDIENYTGTLSVEGYEYKDPTTSVGDGSHAEGITTTSSGFGSHSEGRKTEANGIASHAEGMSSHALGAYSHAEGAMSYAYGPYSHSEGGACKTGIDIEKEAPEYFDRIGLNQQAISNYETEYRLLGLNTPGAYAHAEGDGARAVADGSHAEGCYSKAGSVDYEDGKYVTHGKWSHAEGHTTRTMAEYCHAEGVYSVAGDASLEDHYSYSAHAEGYSTKAFGNSSHSEGYETTASGKCSHAEGEGSTASGTGSHAEGYKCIASGKYAHADGLRTEAKGAHSYAGGIQSTASQNGAFAFGEMVVATGYNQFAVGKYNEEDNDALFIVGNGTSSQRNNAFVVRKNGTILIDSRPIAVLPPLLWKQLEGWTFEQIANFKLKQLEGAF